MNRPRSLVLLVILALSIAGRIAAEEAKKPAETDFELYQIFADTLDQIERNYVKDVSRRELMEAAIEGVLGRLDPYSNYISPEDIGRFKSSVEHQFGGIGIQIGVEQGQLKVISPRLGTPAYRAGLESGDAILEPGDDWKALYYEARLAMKPSSTGDDVARWFWAETAAGQVLRRVRDRLDASEDPRWKAAAFGVAR